MVASPFFTCNYAQRMAQPVIHCAAPHGLTVATLTLHYFRRYPQPAISIGARRFSHHTATRNASAATSSTPTIASLPTRFINAPATSGPPKLAALHDAPTSELADTSATPRKRSPHATS